MKKKNGFTLIELLAVIIILGVIMIIAIPSVSGYVVSSKKKTYSIAGEQYLTNVKNGVNDLKYTFTDLDTSYYVPIECINLGKGGQSPFGEWRKAYVIVTFSETGKYNYYWTSLDSTGYKMDITPENEFSNDKIKSNSLELDTGIGIEGRPFIEVMDKTTCEVGTRTEATSNYGNYILAYETNIGDFVNYDAGVWTTTKAKPTSSTPYTFGGYTSGQSKNNTVNCAAASANLYNGWRVWDINGSTVTLIHAGTPECYYHPNATNSGYKSQYILTSNKSTAIATTDPVYDSVTPRDWSTYLNTNYAVKTEGLDGYFPRIWSAMYKNSTMITNPTPGAWCVPSTSTIAVFNDVINNGSFGYYWFGVGSGSRNSFRVAVESCQATEGYWATSYMESFNYNLNYGVRPIVTLKNRVAVSGKVSTIVGTNGTTTKDVWQLADPNE